MDADASIGVRAVAERTPTATCLVRDGRITYANPAMRDLVDASEEDLVGERFAEFVHPDHRNRVGDALYRARDGTSSVEFELATPDDDPSDRRIVRGDWRSTGTGRDRRQVGSLVDVTARAQRVRELERDSEMLESLLANVPMSIYFKDRQSRHERVSSHTVCQDEDSCITNEEGKMHPHPEDLIGKSDFDVYSGEMAAAAIEEDRDVMRSEEPMFDEVTESVTNLGETIYTSTTKAPRYDDDGDVIGIVGVTMDVTERLTYERELERQNDRLEEFTEVLSHDLRNPLNVAQGNVELLREDRDDPRLVTIDESLDRMSTLISEIRSFVLEGRTVESPEPIELACAATEAWGSVDTGDADLSVDATHTVRADPDRLRRLLENLYRNTLEHATEADSTETSGTAGLCVTVGDLSDGFFVADDGPGIPDDEKDAVFERGFTTDDDGTGFGLAIVQNIAEAHDWTVSVTDSETGGARFEFRGVVRVDPDATEHF